MLDAESCIWPAVCLRSWGVRPGSSTVQLLDGRRWLHAKGGLTVVAVVFIDLVGSSRVPERRALLQKQLIGLKEHTNEFLGERVAIPFQVVWGDELKGVVSELTALWDLYRQCFSFMQGTPFSFAVGLGTIDTPLEFGQTTDINLADGTAFKAARKALDHLKATGVEPYRLRFEVAGDSYLCQALNAYIGIMNDLLDHMTPAQRRAFRQEVPWHVEKDALPASTISRQSMWETLQRARIDAYRQAEKGIVALLKLATNNPATILQTGDRKSVV